MKFRLFAASLLITAVPALADPAVGQWVTVHDDDGSHKSVVNISVNDEGKLQGTVIEILQEEEKGKLCEECPDDFKNQPIEGLTFMWGLEKEGEGEWESGHILDPESGKIYKSKLEVGEDGETLEVRGYIGVSWIGRSQTWLKYEEPAQTAEATDAAEEASEAVSEQATTATAE